MQSQLYLRQQVLEHRTDHDNLECLTLASRSELGAPLVEIEMLRESVKLKREL
jgi:hypothetical protein